MGNEIKAYGGTVIEASLSKVNQGVVYVRFCEWSKTSKEPSFGSILLFRNEQSEKIELGDTIWYKGKVAMWTPYASFDKVRVKFDKGSKYDIKIPRVGEANVPHPDYAILSHM